jgi:hypothetical protein
MHAKIHDGMGVMFLIRIAFWVALIALLLPTDQRQQEKLMAVASDTARRVATFCERNTSACERGAHYWAAFKQKLEFGARLAFDIASERPSGKSAAPEPVSPSAARVDRAKGTLTPSDLSPDWRLKPSKGSGA